MPVSTAGRRHLPPGLTIVHEDRDIIVIDKPAGMLTMASDSEKARTAYAALTDYVRKGNPKSPHRVFIVHRLDRETSGLVLFARSEQAKRTLQERWESTTKVYAAAVHGRMDKPAGTVISHLVESGVHKVYATTDTSLGRMARTEWRVVRDNGKFSLLDVTILTGRKHQIRVHLADLGHPIAGDRKYGVRDDASRLALHARSLTFAHPWSGQEMTCELPVPSVLTRLAG